MPVEISVTAFAFVLVMVTFGALIQGSIGFGLGFALAPVLTLIVPQAVPATILFLTLPVVVTIALRERKAINVRGFLLITAGRIPGTLVGVLILVIVPVDLLAVVLGLMILAGVAMSAIGAGFELQDRTQFVAGLASGIMGTTVAIGGPPLALVYQDRSGAELRSTLSVAFVVGVILSLAGLTIASKVQGWHVLFALELLPGLVIGLLASNFAAPFLDKRWLRPAVLIFAAVSAVIVVLKGIVG
jgi:uncharacterized membrane protein YfcA